MERPGREYVSEVSPLLADIRCSSSISSSSISSSNNNSSSSNTSSGSENRPREGLLFLGSGGSASTPQINHFLALGDPSHPFHAFACGAAPLPPLQQLQRQAVAYRWRRRQQQLKDSCSDEVSSCPEAAAAAEAAAAEAAAAGLEGRELEVAARDARNAACVTCLTGMLFGDSHNRRRNISLIFYVEGKQILIDCGKTIRDSLLAFSCTHQLSSVDAVFLTHDHMDAIGGLDDLRDLQPFDRPQFPHPTAAAAAKAAAGAAAVQGYRWYAPKEWIRCFLGVHTFASLTRSYCYLLRPFVERCCMRSSSSSSSNTAAAAKEEEVVVEETEDGEFAITSRGRLLLKRKVACLDFCLLNDKVLLPPAAAAAAAAVAPTAAAAAAAAKAEEELMQQLIPEARLALQRRCGRQPLSFAPVDPWGFSALDIPGVQTPIFSFPIYHGGTYVCLGLIALGAEPFLLLSDVTVVPPSVLQRLLELPRPEVLVLDAIGENPHAAHFSLQEALDLGVLLQPRRLLFVGMDCCLEHEATNSRLAAWLETHKLKYKEIKGVDTRIEEVRLAHDGLYCPFATAAA